MVLIEKENSFAGYVSAGERKYFFEINNSNGRPNESLRIDWRLKKLLGHSLDEFLRRQFSNVQEFHDELSRFVRDNVKTSDEHSDWLKKPLALCSLVKSLQEDIKAVGKYIKDIDIDGKTVVIEILDVQFRTHKAVLKLPTGYPKEPVKVAHHDLPQVKNQFNESNCNFTGIHTVTEFTKKFLLFIKTYQDFWNIVSTIDSQHCVLDPPNPTYKDTFRRIKLTETLSVGITLNPVNPRQMPDIKLFGCQSDIEKCREVLQRSLQNEMWDCEEDLLYNLSNVLDVTIPNKMFAEDADLFEMVKEEECAICFTWRLNESIPSEVCELPSCKSMFHSECLFTYLSAFPKNRESFGKIQGECPNCDGVIFCSVPKLKS